MGGPRRDFCLGVEGGIFSFSPPLDMAAKVIVNTGADNDSISQRLRDEVCGGKTLMPHALDVVVGECGGPAQRCQ